MTSLGARLGCAFISLQVGLQARITQAQCRRRATNWTLLLLDIRTGDVYMEPVRDTLMCSVDPHLNQAVVGGSNAAAECYLTSGGKQQYYIML